MKNLTVMFSSEKMDWTTPQDFYNKLNDEFNFTLDPCSTKENAKCNKFYTIEDNWLKQDWSWETVFCNPPYGREISNWVKKCSEEKTKIVLLIPARTDTKYFHDYIYKKENVEIRFIKWRLKFWNGNNPAPFPSMICIFN